MNIKPLIEPPIFQKIINGIIIYNINRFVLQESYGFTLKVSDCEELVKKYRILVYVDPYARQFIRCPYSCLSALKFSTFH